jgi:hypothetical protein
MPLVCNILFTLARLFHPWDFQYSGDVMKPSPSPFAQAVPAGPTLTARAGWLLLAWSFYICWLGVSGVQRVRLRMHHWLHGHVHRQAPAT